MTVASESLYSAKQKRAIVEMGCGVAGTTLGIFVDEVQGIESHSSGLPGWCIANRTTCLEDDYR